MVFTRKVKAFFYGNNINGGGIMINFKMLPNSDKPRERLYNYGAENLSNDCHYLEDGK